MPRKFFIGVLLALIVISVDYSVDAAAVVTYQGNTVSLGEMLDENSFALSMERWSSYVDTTSSTKGFLIDFKRAVNGNGIQGQDNGRCEWYFELPVDCLEDKSTTFNGLLMVTLGHTDYSDNSEGLVPGWDVMLWGDEHKVRLGVKNVFKTYTTSMYETYYLPLNSSTPWQYIDSGVAASDSDLVRVLTSLSLIRIRGGLYSGPETTVLKTLRWHESTDGLASSSTSSSSSSSSASSSSTDGCAAKCRAGRRHYISTQTEILSSSSGTLSSFQFSNVPRMCTSGLLEISVIGNLYSADAYLQVLSEEGESLGYVFKKEYAAKSASTMISDVLYPVLHKSKMVRYSSDGVITFSLVIPAGSLASGGITFVRSTLSFGSGACYRSIKTQQITSSPASFSFTFTGIYNALSQAAFILTVSNSDSVNTPDSLSAANSFVVSVSGTNTTVLDKRQRGKIGGSLLFVGYLDSVDLGRITSGSNSLTGRVDATIPTMSSQGFSVSIELMFAPEYCFVQSAVVDRSQNAILADGAIRDEFGFRLRSDVGDAYWPAPPLQLDGLVNNDLGYLFQSAPAPVGDALLAAAAFWQTALEDRSMSVHTAKEVGSGGINPTVGPPLGICFAQLSYSASSVAVCGNGAACMYAHDASYKYPIMDSVFVSRDEIAARVKEGKLILAFSHNSQVLNLFYVTLSYAVAPPSG